MNQITIITGNQGAGKTILAMKLASGKNAIWMRNLNFNSIKKALIEETGYVILDEISDVKSTARELLFLTTNNSITIREPYDSAKKIIPFPHFIMTAFNLDEIPKELQEKSTIIQL